MPFGFHLPRVETLCDNPRERIGLRDDPQPGRRRFNRARKFREQGPQQIAHLGLFHAGTLGDPHRVDPEFTHQHLYRRGPDMVIAGHHHAA